MPMWLIEEGHNTIQARLVDNHGNIVTAVSNVALDTTPPYVTVESHEDNQTVYTDTITITGLINDIVRGTVSEGQASVNVSNTTNGTSVNASIDNRSYRADNIGLNEGQNQIILTGTDAVGNQSQTTLTLIYALPGNQQIQRISGQDQSANINTALNNPLTVKLIDSSSGIPIPQANTAVIWRLEQGSGSLLPTPNPDNKPAARGILTLTDSNGIASARFTLGSRAGAGQPQGQC